MGNKKIGLGLMLNLIGAMFAYLIGSGFASGQETMQYFSGWGSVWASLGVAAIALLIARVYSGTRKMILSFAESTEI